MINLEELTWLTQIDKSVSLKTDRTDELASFLDTSRSEAHDLYRSYNVENSRRVVAKLFEKQSHEAVVKDYRDDDFLLKSLTRLMLHYNRFGLAHAILKEILEISPFLFGKRFLDYGCGASDYGLAAAVLGAKPIVSDISGGPLEFAVHRYKLRSIEVQAIPVTEEKTIPDIPECDIINSTEVLEHVVDPPALIKAFADALPSGGIFTFSDYPRKPKKVGGNHLKVAADLRFEALDVLNSHFDERWKDQAVGYIYVRK